MADDEDWGGTEFKALSLGGGGDELSAEAQAAVDAANAAPADAGLQAAAAAAYMGEGLYDEAIAAYDAALKIDGTNAAYLKGKAEAQLEAGDAEGASATVQQALSADAENADLLYLLGNAQAASDDNKGARESYAKAVAANDSHVAAWLALANVDNQDAKAQDSALEAYRKVIALDGKNAAAYIGASVIVEAQGDLKEAAGLLASAVAVDGDVNKRARLIRLYDSLDNDADREAARSALHADFKAGNLGAGGDAGQFCCSKFESGDKLVMGFDLFEPAGDNKTKYSFNVYPKGQVHDDNITHTLKVELNGGSYALVKYPGGEAVHTFGDAVPAFGDVKTQVQANA